MTNATTLLVQYRVFADRRLHYGRMYWLNIAFVLSGLLAGTAVFGGIDGGVRAWLSVAGGVAALQMGFIAYRLQSIEDTYEHLMSEIEQQLNREHEGSVLVAPLSRRFGARAMATASLGIVGTAMIIAGAMSLS